MPDITARPDGTFELVTPKGRATSQHREALERLQSAIAEEGRNVSRFLTAWREAVRLAGPHLFGVPDHGDVTARERDDLQPDEPLIEAAIGPMSHGEKLFLLAVCGFYDAQWSRTLADRLGQPITPADLAATLDSTRRQVLADLMTSYGGW